MGPLFSSIIKYSLIVGMLYFMPYEDLFIVCVLPKGEEPNMTWERDYDERHRHKVWRFRLLNAKRASCRAVGQRIKTGYDMDRGDGTQAKEKEKDKARTCPSK